MSRPVQSLPGALRWQCRRGMRELDVLLDTWLERHYLAAGADRKAAFEALLRLPDTELSGYLLGRDKLPDAVAADVIREIRGLYST